MVQEGETPTEDPIELIKEMEIHYERLEFLSFLKNRLFQNGNMHLDEVLPIALHR